MESFHWGKQFETGLIEVDRQHHFLVDLINRFGDLLMQIAQVSLSDLETVLNELADYAHYHFDMEVRIMRELAYPLMGDHVHEHQELIKQFIRLKGEITGGLRDPLYLGFQIQLFLSDWFANHTTKTDRHLGRFIRDNAGKHGLS